MTIPTAVRPRPRGAGYPWRQYAPLAVAIAVAAALVLPLLTWAMAMPSRVDRVSFENPTPYDIAVEASDTSRRGWMDLGTVRRGATTVKEELVDQGDEWVLRFRAQGENGGEIRVTRDELRASGWTVAIPTTVGDTLKARAAPPNP